MAELIIVFREVLEATLIVGILYTYLNKIGQDDAIIRLWQGVLVALAASLVGSLLFQRFAGGFDGQASKLFEGVVMILAAAILGSMIIWMAKNSNIAGELQDKAAEALKNDDLGYSIFALAFISVFREGIETILFLYGVTMQTGGLSVPLSFVGAGLGIGVGYMIFIQGRKVPLKTFFNVSSFILIFVAAGMLTYGVHELESAKVIPYYGGRVTVEGDQVVATRFNGDSKIFQLNESSDKKKTISSAEKWASRIWDINPPKHADGTYPVFHDKGAIGGLFKGLFGYNGDPSWVELAVWICAIFSMNFMWKKVSSV